MSGAACFPHRHLLCGSESVTGPAGEGCPGQAPGAAKSARTGPGPLTSPRGTVFHDWQLRFHAGTRGCSLTLLALGWAGSGNPMSLHVDTNTLSNFYLGRPQLFNTFLEQMSEWQGGPGGCHAGRGHLAPATNVLRVGGAGCEEAWGPGPAASWSKNLPAARREAWPGRGCGSRLRWRVVFKAHNNLQMLAVTSAARAKLQNAKPQKHIIFAV